FIAPINGTEQLFEVDYIGLTKKLPTVTQITKGDFDLTGIVGFSGDNVILSRQDMTHATEIFSFDLKKKSWRQITSVNNNMDGKRRLAREIFRPNRVESTK